MARVSESWLEGWRAAWRETSPLYRKKIKARLYPPCDGRKGRGRKS